MCCSGRHMVDGKRKREGFLFVGLRNREGSGGERLRTKDLRDSGRVCFIELICEMSNHGVLTLLLFDVVLVIGNVTTRVVRP